jgi:hypothetical protein
MGRDRTDCPVRCPLEYFGAAPGFLRLVSYSWFPTPDSLLLVPYCTVIIALPADVTPPMVSVTTVSPETAVGGTVTLSW